MVLPSNPNDAPIDDLLTEATRKWLDEYMESIRKRIVLHAQQLAGEAGTTTRKLPPEYVPRAASDYAPGTLLLRKDFSWWDRILSGVSSVTVFTAILTRCSVYLP